MPTTPRTRTETFWDLFDFSEGLGLEIGPLHRTIVERDAADVRYVDVHDRDGLLAHYAGDPAVDPDLIPHIDYWLIQDDGRTLSLVEATKADAPFAWVMASHVIEHVPDLIGWLKDVADVCVDGAALVLAVPDRRYCFDAHRPPTTVGQMIQAHDDGDTRPSVRAVYDYFSSAVQGASSDLWNGHVSRYQDRYHSLDEARRQTEDARNGQYVDSHVWVFSTQSFLEQMHELRTTGLSSWYVETLEPTAVGDLEFKVVMRLLPRDADTTAELPDELRSTAPAPDWLVTPEVAHLRRRVEHLEERLENRKAKVASLRRRAARREARRDKALTRLTYELEQARSVRSRPLAQIGRIVRSVRGRTPR